MYILMYHLFFKLMTFILIAYRHSTIIFKWKKDIPHRVLHLIIDIGNFMCLLVICCSLYWLVYNKLDNVLAIKNTFTHAGNGYRSWAIIIVYTVKMRLD